jgi:hypothetical protein
MPDGRVARFEVPEGTTPEQAQEMIEAEIRGKGSKGRSTVSELGRQLGLTARHLVEGVTAPVNMIGDALGLRSSEAVSGALTSAGLPTPEGSTERVVGDVSRAMAGAGGIQALGKGLAAAAGPVAQGVGEVLSAAPGVQTVSAATGAGAAGITREEGGGPGAQIAAGIAGAMAPSVAKAGVEAALRGAVRGGEQGRQAVADTVKTFEDAGSTPSVGQATGNMAIQAVESGLARTPGSSGVMARAAEQQADEMGARVERIADAVFPKASAAKAGAQIEVGIKRFVGRFKSEQGNLYATLDRHIPKGQPVSVANTLSRLDDLTQPITGAPSLSGGQLGKPAVEQLKNQLQADAQGGVLPYEAIRQLRSRIGEKLSNPKLTDDIDRSTWKQLYSALSDDMAEAARQAGPQAEKAFTRANAFTRAGHDRIDTFLERVSGKDSVEKIFQAATNPSELREGASTIGAVMKSLEPEQRSAVSAAVIRRMGLATPGNQNDLGEVFSSQTFLTNWNKISPEAKRTLFAGSKSNELRVNLDRIAEAANSVREGSKVFANPSGTAPAAANIAGGTALALSVGTGNFGLAATLLAGAGAANLSARLLTHAPFVRWLAQTTKISGGALPAQMNMLAQMAEQERDPSLRRDLDAYAKTLTEQIGTQQKR